MTQPGHCNACWRLLMATTEQPIVAVCSGCLRAPEECTEAPIKPGEPQPQRGTDWVRDVLLKEHGGNAMTRSDDEGGSRSESEAAPGSTPTPSGPLPPPTREQREHDPEALSRWWESLRVEHGESEVMIQVPPKKSGPPGR